MFCRYCGNKLPDDARFCDQCGKPCASITDSDDVDKNADWGALTPTGTTIQNTSIDDDVREKATWEGTTPPVMPVNKTIQKQTDTNSPSIIISKPKIISFTVNKEPKNNVLTCKWDTINASRLQIVVSDTRGKLIKTIPIEGEKGEISSQIDVGNNSFIQIDLYAYDNYGQETQCRNFLWAPKINVGPVPKRIIGGNPRVGIEWTSSYADKITCDKIQDKKPLPLEGTVFIHASEFPVTFTAENSMGTVKVTREINYYSNYDIKVIIIVVVIMCITFFLIFMWVLEEFDLLQEFPRLNRWWHSRIF